MNQINADRGGLGMELCGIYKKARGVSVLNDSEMYVEGMNAYDDGDYEKAMEWFLKAAELNHVGAQFACGLMYDKGKGIAADAEKALEWYEKAAGQGHVEAQEKIEKLLAKLKR